MIGGQLTPERASETHLHHAVLKHRQLLHLVLQLQDGT
jgi:hypothetical protein